MHYSVIVSDDEGDYREQVCVHGPENSTQVACEAIMKAACEEFQMDPDSVRVVKLQSCMFKKHKGFRRPLPASGWSCHAKPMV